MEATINRTGMALTSHVNGTKNNIVEPYSAKKSGRFTAMCNGLRNKHGAKPWVEASIENLEKAIKSIQNGEIGAFLRFMASCWHYSLQNQFLIVVQHPTAEVCAGMTKWREDYGAWIKQGQKPIWILAPNLIKKKDEITGEMKTICIGFFPVKVWAQDQVDKMIPKVCEPIQGDSGKIADAMKVVEAYGLKVEENKSLANGSIDLEAGVIHLKEENSKNQKTKTIFHEIGHWIDIKVAELDISERNREDEEIVAESSAYVVCQKLGLDTLSYSAQYVASWSKMDCDKIHEMLSRIKFVVDEILSRL